MNCQSIKNKIPEFQTFIESTDPDIVLGNESWLQQDIKDSEIFPLGYSIFRKDRTLGNKKAGGGVFIMVRKEFTCSEIKLNAPAELELVFVEVKMKGQQNLKVGSFYRPPWSDDKYMEDFAKVLTELDSQGKGNIWIGGDFNLPNIKWEDQKPIASGANVKISSVLLDAVNDHSLTQVVDHPTRKGSMLDLFFTTHPGLINRNTLVPPLTKEADHDIVFVDINTKADIPKQVKRTRYIYNKADWNSMKEEMKPYTVPDGTAQEQWDHLEKKLNSLIDKHVPSKPAKPNKQKPWINREIITLMHRRDRAFKTWKQSLSEHYHQKFVKLRSRCQAKIREAHKEYLDGIFNLEDVNKSDNKASIPKRFWSYVTAQRKDNNSVSPLRKDGVLISDAPGKAEILNQQYTSVFTKEDTSNIPSKPSSNIPTCPPIKVTQKGVEKLLKDLKPDKAAGPDQISPRLLKELAEVLASALTTIFQTSIDTGCVPKQWREAVVAPVFKKGDKHEASNYRPVSLTCICCKICEHIVAKAIMEHLESNNLLSDFQHGFRQFRSCETQLLLFVDEMARGMCDGDQTDIAIMDFSKAFDVVPHERLLVKLEHYGIRGDTHQWIRAFLSNRSQQVIVDGAKSSPAPVTSGVPQGSVVGPILFLVFINDMPECIKSRCRLFADDSIIYREVSCEEDSRALQEDLEALQEWEVDWGMSFNPSKCHVMHVTRKRQPLYHTYYLKGQALGVVDTAAYLGVHLSKDLTWHDHIGKVTAKANRSLGFIRRNIQKAPSKTKELAYKSLVRPSLEYAATVWDPHQKGLVNDIEKVQRRAARYVSSSYDPRASVTEMLRNLQWETLQQRRWKARVTMCYKIVHHIVAIPDIQFVPVTVNTRGNQLKFIQIQARTNYYRYTFFPAVIPLWNALPVDIAQADKLEDFKLKLASFQLPPPRI